MSFLEELEKSRQAAATAQLAQQRQRALDNYNANKQALDAKYAQPTGLASLLGGIGKSIGDIGTSLYDMFGSAWAGLTGGNEGIEKFKKDLYKTENLKDAYAKSAGTALNAATTLGTSVLPMAGANTVAGKLLGGKVANTVAGAVGGAADELQQEGANADLGQAAKRAAAGAAGGLVAGNIAGKIGNANSRLGSALLNNKLATSALGRGAIAGAVGGATGAGTAAALDGGDVAGAALQGATSGALSGATQAGIMNLANIAKQDLWDAQKARQAQKNARTTTNVVADQPIKATTDEPFMAYGESGLAKQTKRGRALDKLAKFGETLEGAQSNVTRQAARDLGIESTGKVIESVRKKTGLTNLDTQAQLAKELTGGNNSLMDTIQRNALAATEDGGNGYLADTTKLLGEVDSIVDNYATTSALGEGGVQKLKDDLRTDILNRRQDLLSKANNLKSIASDLRGKSIVNPTESDSAKAKIYTEVASKLDDLSYNAIPKANVKDMFDATITEMRARATQAQNNGNKEIATAYTQLANALDKQPRTIKAYRSFKKDFVDASIISRLTNQAQNGAAFQLGTSASGTAKRTVSTLLQEPTNKILAKAGGAINNLVDNLDTVTPQYTANAQNNVTNTQAVRTPIQPISEGVQTTLNNFIGRTQANLEADKKLDQTKSAMEYANLEDTRSAIDSIDAQLAALQAQKPISQAEQNLIDIQNGMNNALAAGDISAYNQLASLYSTAYKMYEAQNPQTESNLSTAEKNQIAKLESAGTALDQLESLYAKAGGGQGIIGGNIANFLGGLGLSSDVNTYNQLAQGLINQIGAAIGKTDSLNTEGEVQRALSLVPKITDDNQTAMNKLATLRQLLQQNTGTYNELYGA